MSKLTVPKYKIDRKLGVNLWGRPKSPHNTRPYRPGQHGKTTRRKLSNYALQLSEKQKLKFYYGMKETQFKRFFSKAMKVKGKIAAAFIGFLEQRLDTFVYRIKWAPTIFAAKQMVKHKHVLVNGKVVSIQSYLLKEGDTVELIKSMRDHAIVKDAIALQERVTPPYIEVMDGGLVGKLSKIPAPEEVPYPVEINPQLIIEYYAKRL